MKSGQFGNAALGRPPSRRGFVAGGAGLLAASGTRRVFAAPQGEDAVRRAVLTVNPKVVGWYRDIHQHPELGNQEVRTAGIGRDSTRRARHVSTIVAKVHSNFFFSIGESRPAMVRCRNAYAG